MTTALCLIAFSFLMMPDLSLLDLLKIAAALAFGLWWVIFS